MQAHEYFLNFGNGTGLTILDMLLLGLCPIATMLGTMVANAVSKITTKPEFTPATQLPARYLAQLQGSGSTELDRERMLLEHNAEQEQWYRMALSRERRYDSIRLPFVGLVLGLVIALYFVGAITEHVTSLARILGLCVLLGYQAPSLWLTQERALKRLVDKKVEAIVGK